MSRSRVILIAIIAAVIAAVAGGALLLSSRDDTTADTTTTQVPTGDPVSGKDLQRIINDAADDFDAAVKASGGVEASLLSDFASAEGTAIPSVVQYAPNGDYQLATPVSNEKSIPFRLYVNGKGYLSIESRNGADAAAIARLRDNGHGDAKWAPTDDATKLPSIADVARALAKKIDNEGLKLSPGPMQVYNATVPALKASEVPGGLLATDLKNVQVGFGVNEDGRLVGVTFSQAPSTTGTDVQIPKVVSYTVMNNDMFKKVTLTAPAAGSLAPAPASLPASTSSTSWEALLDAAAQLQDVAAKAAMTEANATGNQIEGFSDKPLAEALKADKVAALIRAGGKLDAKNYLLSVGDKKVCVPIGVAVKGQAPMPKIPPILDSCTF